MPIKRETVSHYTSLDSAIAIIKNIEKGHITFRASHYSCMNDPNEIVFAEKKVRQVVKDINPYPKGWGFVPYIISFSRRHDSPLMWRLYRADIEFVFDKKRLEQYQVIDESHKFYCGNVEYVNVRQSRKSADIVKRLTSQMNVSNPHYMKLTGKRGSPYKPHVDPFLNWLVFPFIKHEDFAPEMEWRIVVPNVKSENAVTKELTELPYEVCSEGCRYGLPYFFMTVPLPLEALTEIVIHRQDQQCFNKIKSALNLLLEKNDAVLIKISKTKTASVR